jgi:hypothetical protein
VLSHAATARCVRGNIQPLGHHHWEHVEERSLTELTLAVVRMAEFATAVGYDVVASDGKSRDSMRTIDLDAGLVKVLRVQRKNQAAERLTASDYEDRDYLFTKPAGGGYHP